VIDHIIEKRPQSQMLGITDPSLAPVAGRNLRTETP
jgi:hypothetical protein